LHPKTLLFMDEIINRIFETRKKRGYSLEYMGNEIGVSESAYRKMEKGEVRLTLENFIKIAKTLKVSEAELLSCALPLETADKNRKSENSEPLPGIESYQKENKEITIRLIDCLEKQVLYLQEENQFLRSLLSENYSFTQKNLTFAE